MQGVRWFMIRINLISNFTCPSCLLSLCHAVLPIPQASGFFVVTNNPFGVTWSWQGKILTGMARKKSRSGTTPCVVNNL